MILNNKNEKQNNYTDTMIYLIAIAKIIVVGLAICYVMVKLEDRKCKKDMLKEKKKAADIKWVDQLINNIKDKEDELA
jgi:hypothetical protein